MNLREAESSYDRALRLGTIGEDHKKGTPMAILLLLMCAILVMVYAVQYNGVKQDINVGNPYNCADCKRFGGACKEHREFNSKDFLLSKVETFGYNYIPGKSEPETLEMMYGVGNTYNLACDFCGESGVECETCKHDRLVITDWLDSYRKGNKAQYGMCPDCKLLGYPNCGPCRSMMIQDIDSNKIHNNN